MGLRGGDPCPSLLYSLCSKDNIFKKLLGQLALSVSFAETWKMALSYEVASGSEITPCNKIDGPLVAYIYLGNVMTFKTTIRT